MKTPPYKQNGVCYGHGSNGKRVCLGARMGRPNVIPDDYNGEKLNLRRVPFVGGAYDQGGAYWGMGSPLWCAWGETATEQVEIFVRATDRETATEQVEIFVRATDRETAKRIVQNLVKKTAPVNFKR